jgi:hypothetical protein
MPAPMRDDADVQVNILNNIGHLSTVEAASRVAFSLRLGIEAQKELDKQREELL